MPTKIITKKVADKIEEKEIVAPPVFIASEDIADDEEISKEIFEGLKKAWKPSVSMALFGAMGQIITHGTRYEFGLGHKLGKCLGEFLGNC